MTNFNRYLYGILFGMIGEYLYRVAVNKCAIVSLFFISMIILFDIYKNNK